jgi:hypothetical protein
MLYLAFQKDNTRIATFMMDRIGAKSIPRFGDSTGRWTNV